MLDFIGALIYGGVVVLAFLLGLFIGYRVGVSERPPPGGGGSGEGEEVPSLRVAL